MGSVEDLRAQGAGLRVECSSVVPMCPAISAIFGPGSKGPWFTVFGCTRHKFWDLDFSPAFVHRHGCLQVLLEPGPHFQAVVDQSERSEKMDNNVCVGQGVLHQYDAHIVPLVARRSRQGFANVAVPHDERGRSKIDYGAPKRESCKGERL